MKLRPKSGSKANLRPQPSSESVRLRMENQARRDTGIERALRSSLHRRGLRFFVDKAPLRGLRRRADILFPRARVAVYVDGCFWHGCPEHGTWPKANSEWWRNKIETNIARDLDTNRRLIGEGWTVIRVWEHEDVSVATDRVATTVYQAAQDT
jgi:DNA mismatch endonuclease (patch repair protein)